MSPRDRLRHAQVALALLVALAGCSTVATTAGRLTDPDKEYYETFEGPYIDKVDKKPSEGTAATAAGAEGLRTQAELAQGVVDLPELERYLNGILDRLKAVSPRPGYPAHVYLIPGDSFDAHMSADGGIFLSLGVLRVAESEDELAAVLAHELAHLELDHKELNLLDRMSRFAGGALSMVSSLGDSMGGGGPMSPNLTGSSLKAELGQAVVERFLTPTFTRQQEDEADLLGLDLVIRAGYSVSQALTMMQRQAGHESAAAKAQAEFKLRQRAQRALQRQQGGADQTLGQALGSALDDLDKSLSESLNGVQDTHRSPEARLGSMQGYLNDRYGDLAPVSPNKGGLLAAKSEARTRTILAAYARAREAIERSNAGDTKRALELIQSTLRGPTAKHILPRWYAYNIDMKRRREDEAVRHLKVVMETPQAPLLFYETLIQMNIERSRLSEAARVAEEASRRFDEPLQLLPKLIYLNTALNREDVATRMLIRCRTNAPPEVVELCVAASQGDKLTSAARS